MKNKDHRIQEKGFIFIGVFFVMIALIAACGLLISSAQTEQHQAANLVRVLRARTAAESGVDALLSKLAPASAFAAGWSEKAQGDVGAARYEASATPFNPAQYQALPGAQNLGLGSIIEIVSTGQTQGLKGSAIKQRITAIVDNGPQKPRVILWMIETPAE